MKRLTMTQREFLAQHRGHVQALEFEAESMLAEGANPLAVVGALLWASALVAERSGIPADRFARLVEAMLTSAVECGDGDDDDDGIGGTWGEA